VTEPESPRAAAERIFREESGRIVATLIRVFGDFDLAEEAMQDAFAVALERWPADGVPANPGAWITTTARRKAVDRLAPGPDAGPQAPRNRGGRRALRPGRRDGDHDD
jgi:predicted RNA polymerase sigma factor